MASHYNRGGLVVIYMNSLVKAFVDLCLFRIGPQDLPASAWLRNLTLLLYFCLGATLSMTVESVENSLQAAILDTLFLALLAMVPLRLIGKSSRINQTLTAIYGSGSLFNLAITPLAIIYFATDQQAGPLLSTSIAMIGLWNLAVLGNILRHALNLPLIAGIAIAITYLAVSSQLSH